MFAYSVYNIAMMQHLYILMQSFLRPNYRSLVVELAWAILDDHENVEVDIVKESPKSFQSVFCIMQKLEKKIENELFQII